MAENELVCKRDDFLRRRTKLSLITPESYLLNDASVRDAEEILFNNSFK